MDEMAISQHTLPLSPLQNQHSHAQVRTTHFTHTNTQSTHTVVLRFALGQQQSNRDSSFLCATILVLLVVVLGTRVV